MSFRKIFLGLSLVLCIAFQNAQATSKPLERTKGFVDAMIAVEVNNEKSYQKIDAFINYEHITSATIKPHQKYFNPQQAKKFKKLLRALIRKVSYPDSGAFYKGSKYTYRKPEIRGSQVITVMDVLLVEEDLDLELGYTWEKANTKRKEWKLIDLSFDGDSLVKDYQNQFGRILTKGDANELINKLESKLAELAKENK